MEREKGEREGREGGEREGGREGGESEVQLDKVRHYLSICMKFLV